MGLDKRFYGFVSGTGAGKTFAGAYRLWLNADWWNPESMGAIIVPDKSQFIDNIKPILEEFGLVGDGESGLWEYQSVYTDEPGLHTHNDQRILILSADNQRQIGRIKGKNLGYVWMDEEAEIDARAREIAQQRLRVGQYPNLFITTTPEGYNHTYDFFAGDVDPSKSEHGSGMLYECDDRLAVVGVPPEANPAIRDEDIANMRQSLPEEIVQQEIEGRFVQVGGGVFQRGMFQYENPEGIANHLQAVIGVDPAATADSQAAEERDSDFWGVTVAYPDPNHGEVYVADCIQQRGMTLKEGVALVEKVAKNCKKPKLVIEANQSQRWLQQELADRGLNAVPVQTTRNKEDKIIDLSIPISSGVVKFVDWDEPRFDELHQQMLAWPESNHDDMIDSLALVVNNSDVHTSQSIFGGSYGERDLW
jgi:predicted phage terminase large subunit-like protein